MSTRARSSEPQAHGEERPERGVSQPPGGGVIGTRARFAGLERGGAETFAEGATVSATYYTRLPSPLGPLLLVGTTDALTQVWLPSGRDRREPDVGWIEASAPFAEPVRQLEAYFAGVLRRFDLRLEPAGTPFQRSVWRALLDIPYGETVSYGALARRIDRPTAVRAVGAANGQNPLAIVRHDAILPRPLQLPREAGGCCRV